MYVLFYVDFDFYCYMPKYNMYVLSVYTIYTIIIWTVQVLNMTVHDLSDRRKSYLWFIHNILC